jgi:hypothetical protein
MDIKTTNKDYTQKNEIKLEKIHNEHQIFFFWRLLEIAMKLTCEALIK